MVRRRTMLPILVALAAVGVRSASANPITFTGNVAQDFPATSQDVNVLAVPPAIGQVAQAHWMTDQGWLSGWDIKDVRTSYDKATDTLSVGINTYGIAGDADGNGVQGQADPRTLTSGGVELPHLGGRESITVGIDVTGKGTPQYVAGVPADKSTAGPGTDGFTFASYSPSNSGLAYSYGPTLKEYLGNLASDPSAAHPGFEFTIPNFSKLPGLSLSKGFGLSVFAGSPDDVVAGEVSIPDTWITTPLAQQLPEPSSVLAWSAVLLGGAAWRLRRARRASS